MPTIPALRERLGTRTLFLGGVLVAAMGGFVGSIGDPDFWWHIRTGRWILDNGRLPAHDLFTYTVPGHVWTDHEYLTEVLMWLAFKSTGFAGLSVGFGLITWFGFLLLLRTRYSGSARPPFMISGLGLVLALIAGAPIWGPRAQMITFALACLELFWLAAYLSGRSRAITWFPLVMVVWANLHGGWVIGLGFLGLALTSEILRWLLGGRPAAAAVHCRRLGVILALSLLAVMATPHGLSIYLYPFQTQGSAAQQKLIVEWFSPNFHDNQLHAYEAMLLLLIVGMVARRPSLYQLLLSLSVIVLSLQSVRHIALFVAATTPVLIDTYSAIWRGLAASRPRLQARVDRFRTAPPAPLAAVTVAALLVIAGATSLRIGADLARQTRLNAENYPVAAADWLAAHPEIGTRMYNQYGWGGYLAYRFYPDPHRRVFIFGEAALMGDALLQRYQDVQTLRPDWQTVLESNLVDYVVYNRGEALSNVLLTQPGWAVAFDGDPVAIIFVRQPNR